MKKTAYMPALMVLTAACGTLLSGCSNRTSEYDEYVKMMKAQPAIIDTISSAASYYSYVENFLATVDSLEQKNIDINENQSNEIAELGEIIGKHLEAKQEELAQIPMTLPDDILVPD